MNKTSILYLFILCFSAHLYGQKAEKNTTTEPAEFVVSDSLYLGPVEVDPVSPVKAAFYSAVLPGLGQVYNKKYWKVPIVYGLIGGGIYFYKRNDDLYDRYRTAFKRRKAGFEDDEFWGVDSAGNPLSTPRLSDQGLQDGQERFQRSRDLSLLLTVVFYALNILDANVDAHLRQYNVNDKLSLRVQPYAQPMDAVTNNPNFGLHLSLGFR
ncbi:MAG: DUF5683 domain-containing protein [Flavobacteriaceae bacterium]|nr:DUF5683 domain-containing protein [Flavobacteriaceae bacterium]